MKLFRYHSLELRKQLILFLLVVFIPVLAILLFTGYRQHQHTLRDIEDNANQLIRLFVEEQLHIINQTNQLLNVISHVPAVRDLDLPSCNAFLRMVHKENPQYSTIVVANREGIIECCAIPLKQPIDVKDRTWFQRVSENKEFVIDNFLISRSAKKASLPFAFPVLDDENQLIAAVGAAYDLVNYRDIFSRISLPDASVIFVADRDNVLLYQSNDGDEHIGKILKESRGFEIPGTNKGKFVVNDFDGVKRVYWFERVCVGNETNQVTIAIGVSEQAIYSEPKRMLTINLSLLTVLASLSFVIAWFFGKKRLLDPVNLLVNKTRHVQKGDLSPSNAKGLLPGELSILAQAFDEMLSNLSQREMERDKALDALRSEIVRHKEAVAALSEREERLRILFEQAADAIYVSRKDGRLFKVNEQACQATGYTKEELLSLSVMDVDAQIPSSAQFNELAQNLAHGHPVTMESAHRRKDGSTFPVEVTIALLQTHDGPHLLGIARDITHRKEAERTLRESEEKLSSILSAAHIGIGLVVDRVIMTVNNHLCAMTGYSQDELLYKSSRMLYPSEEHYEEVGREKYRQIDEKGVGTVETKWLRKDGSIIDVLLSSTPLRRDDLSAGVTFTALDITERKRAEEAQMKLRKQLASALEIAHLGPWEYDIAGDLFTFNDHFYRIFRTSAKRAGGYSMSSDEYCSRFVHPEDTHLVAEETRKAIETKDPHFSRKIEHRMLYEDGSVGYISVQFFIVKDFQGRTIKTYGVNQDITERRLAEEERETLQAQLSQAQKMESVGRLAGGVAHDFNNMLGIILGHVEMILDEVGPSQPIFSDLQEIQKAARRSAELTRQLLAFARKQTISPRVLDLNETVEGVLKMLRRLIGENIDLEWMPGGNPWRIKMDPTQIDQVLTNLCVNARDAIDGVGKISIETGNVSFDEAYCAEHPEFTRGEYVLLSVSDTGCGMRKETLGKLFEPFFTTKELGKGTGLGLATVYGIVKQNNGFINVYSEPGIGTTFKIYLPRHGAKAELIEQQDLTTPSVGSAETILLVEDEPSILNMSKRMLERMGYKVLAASTPGEAIRLAEERSGELHLLITDVVMPEMNGRDLAKRILAFYPNIRRLFMSGYTANVIAHHGVLDEGVHFIQKPFSKQDLMARVAEALGEKE